MTKLLVQRGRVLREFRIIRYKNMDKVLLYAQHFK